MIEDDYIIDRRDPILITGANGFIGSRVAETLFEYGFKSLRCFVRPSSNITALKRMSETSEGNRIRIIEGNLVSPKDCEKATDGVSMVYHLAAAMRDKSFPGAFLNCVVVTKRLLEATLKYRSLKRFVNVSSFTVYSNMKLRRGSLLDESCEIENQPELRGEAYCYAKVRQDELVMDYGRKHGIPYVIVRPGVVYGPGRKTISGRIGIDTFGIFLHIGGSNRIPLTYVENCAEAIVLAGLKKGVEGEIFNIVDDDIPTSREFLKEYKKRVEDFKSVYVPRMASYSLCYLWEKYSKWSGGQLPPVFNRKRWSSDWKGNRYSNEKAKRLLGWKPRITSEEGLQQYFEYCKNPEI